MKIEPREYELPSGKALLVRSVTAADAEVHIKFKCMTSGETHFMARYPEECVYSPVWQLARKVPLTLRSVHSTGKSRLGVSVSAVFGVC